MKVRDKKEPPKKKSNTFNATPTILEDEESMDEGEEEESSILVRKVGVRKVGKMFCENKKMSNFRKTRPQCRMKEEKKRWVHATIVRRWDT